MFSHKARSYYQWCRALVSLINQSKIKLFANSLTFYTLLAVVPLLAVLFTLLKSFGIEDFLQGIISDVLAPMGSAGTDVANYLYQFVNNAQAGLLGGIGVIFLLYSVFGLFNKIESALNTLWCIDQRRRLGKKVSGYLSLLMLIVILAAATVGLRVFTYSLLTSLGSNISWLEGLAVGALKMLALLMTAALLAFTYSGAINTRVQLRASFGGGLFCAVLWLPLTTMFAELMSLSTSYSVIYSSFAGLVILLVWINTLWVLFLSGGLVAYFIQFPSLIANYRAQALNPSETEHYAHRIIELLTSRFAQGEVTSLTEIIASTGLNRRQISLILSPLIEAKQVFVMPQADTFMPGADERLTSELIQKTLRGEVRSLNDRSN